MTARAAHTLLSRRALLTQGGALDGTHDAQVRAAATQIACERLSDLILAGPLVRGEQRGRLHDHAVDAVAALGGLLLDEGLLHRVRCLR